MSFQIARSDSNRSGQLFDAEGLMKQGADKRDAPFVSQALGNPGDVILGDLVDGPNGLQGLQQGGGGRDLRIGAGQIDYG